MFAYLESLQTMTSATYRRTGARGSLWVAGAGEAGFGGRRTRRPVEARSTEFALVARSVVAAAVADAAFQERVIAATLGMSMALANVTLAAGTVGSILEEWTALFTLHATGIVLADALEQWTARQLLGAIRMSMAVESSANPQLLQAVEAALLHRLRVEHPIHAVVQVRGRVHALQSDAYEACRDELHQLGVSTMAPGLFFNRDTCNSPFSRGSSLENCVVQMTSVSF